MNPNELLVFMPPDTTAKTVRNMIYWRCDEGNWSAKAKGDKAFVIVVMDEQEHAEYLRAKPNDR